MDIDAASPASTPCSTKPAQSRRSGAQRPQQLCPGHLGRGERAAVLGRADRGAGLLGGQSAAFPPRADPGVTARSTPAAGPARQGGGMLAIGVLAGNPGHRGDARRPSSSWWPMVRGRDAYRDVTKGRNETNGSLARQARVMRRQWCGNRAQASAALLVPFDPQLHLGVERLPHPPRQQGHLAQQPDDFPLAGQGQLCPDAGRVGAGGAQRQQVDLGGVGQVGADLGQPGIEPLFPPYWLWSAPWSAARGQVILLGMRPPGLGAQRLSSHSGRGSGAGSRPAMSSPPSRAIITWAMAWSAGKGSVAQGDPCRTGRRCPLRAVLAHPEACIVAPSSEIPTGVPGQQPPRRVGVVRVGAPGWVGQHLGQPLHGPAR